MKLPVEPKLTLEWDSNYPLNRQTKVLCNKPKPVNFLGILAPGTLRPRTFMNKFLGLSPCYLNHQLEFVMCYSHSILLRLLGFPFIPKTKSSSTAPMVHSIPYVLYRLLCDHRLPPSFHFKAVHPNFHGRYPPIGSFIFKTRRVVLPDCSIEWKTSIHANTRQLMVSIPDFKVIRITLATLWRWGTRRAILHQDPRLKSGLRHNIPLAIFVRLISYGSS